MAADYDPKSSPGSGRSYIVIGMMLILFGIAIIPMSLTAYHTGQPIPLLSGRRRVVHGAQGFFVTFCCVAAGLAGMWASRRKKAS